MRGTELLTRMRVDMTQFDRSLKQSQAELQSFSRVAGALPGKNVFSGLAADAASFAPALSSAPLGIAAVAAALTGAGLAARRAGVEFEASLAKISTLGPDAERSLGATRDAILQTYSSVPITGSVNDLAEANYLLQSSGRSATEAITDLRTAAEASVAGYTGVTTAVDGLTTVTNAWKDSQITTTRASDVLFSAVNVGKATFEEIAQSIGLVAPLAASAGVRFEEVAAAVAVLSNQGIKTSSVFEGLRSAILNIQRPTEDFKKKYAELASEFGASRLARDGIVKFLQDFTKQSGGSRQALNALFTDATGLTTVLGLLKNNGVDAADALKRMETSAGSTETALSKVTTTAAAQEQLIRNQLTGAWTDFGELLRRTTLPLLDGVARALNGLKGGANFLKADVGILQSTLGPGPLSNFDQLRRRGAAASILTQFEANKNNTPELFRGLTDDELRFVRQQLQLAKNTAPKGGPRFPGSFSGFDTAVVLEQNRRAEAARLEAAKKAQGDTAAADAAAARAKEEEEARNRPVRDAAATQRAAAAKRQADELQRERERIVRDADELTEQLKSKAIAALQGTAGVLQQTLDQTLKAGAAKLKSGALGPEGAAALTAQLETFRQIQKELIGAEKQAKRTDTALEAALNQDEIPALNTIAQREKELAIILKSTKGLEARKQLEEQLAKLAAARGEKTGAVFSLPAEDKSIDVRIQQLGDLAQSLATVGDQLGLLPRRSVDALRGIGALVEQGDKLTKAFSIKGSLGVLGKFSAGIGIAGGIASLAAGLLSESPEDKQRREELKRNTEALKRLSENVGDLAAGTVPGRVLAGAGRGFAAVLQENGGAFPGSRDEKQFGDLRGLIANRGGITVAELDKAIAESGLGLQRNATSMQQLLRYFAEADTNAYLNSFAGGLERLDDTLRADGVTDAAEIFRRRVAFFTDPKTGFPALAEAIGDFDLDTVEGRESARERARALYDRVVNGELSIAQFGGLSVPEGRKAILEFISGVFDLNKGGATGTGGFNETRSITEVTGSRLAGLFSSATSYLATIAADVATLRAAIVVGPPVVLTPPSIGSIGSAGATPQILFGPGSIVINVTMTRELLGADAGQTIDRADAFGRVVGGSMIGEIDRQLRERQLRQRLYHGDNRITQ